MRKDYISVTGDAHADDETSFVERFWTDNWKIHGEQPDLSALEQREEYLLMQPYLNRLPKGSRILDGGCGLGEWTVFLGQRGFDAVGIDLSAATVQLLETRFPERQWVRGDIRQTGFETASFDACFAWGTFEHFENGLGDCLNEVHRVLRPGGWLFISVPFQNWRHTLKDMKPLERWDESFDAARGYTAPHRFYQWRFTRPELKRELELRGFRTESVTPIGKAAGVGRWLQWDLPVFKKGTRGFAIARRAFSMILPGVYVNHMLLAVAERRP